jgi:hypothetical protein
MPMCCVFCTIPALDSDNRSNACCPCVKASAAGVCVGGSTLSLLLQLLLLLFDIVADPSPTNENFENERVGDD